MKFLVTSRFECDNLDFETAEVVKCTDGTYGILDQNLQNLTAEGNKEELENFLKLHQEP